MTTESVLESLFTAEDAAPVADVDQQNDQTHAAEQSETGVDESVPPTDETKQEQQEDPIERHKKGLEAGIAAERSKRQAVEREAAELRAKIQQFELQQRKAAERPASQEQEPQESDFATPQEYIRALARFEAKQLRDAERAEEAQAKAEHEAQEQAQHMKRTADEVVLKGQESFQDFDTVINSGLGPILVQETPQAHLFRQALLASKRAHDVAYYLGKNPDEAHRIYALSPLQMVDEIAEIRLTKLDATGNVPLQPKPIIPKTLTQARDARGHFKPATYDGPTPLDDVLAGKK